MTMRCNCRDGNRKPVMLSRRGDQEERRENASAASEQAKTRKPGRFNQAQEYVQVSELQPTQSRIIDLSFETGKRNAYSANSSMCRYT